MRFLKHHYGNTEGPLGFPMQDRAAQEVEAVLRSLPRSDSFAYRKLVSKESPTEILKGERTDVSWITLEDPDRAEEVVLARGMNDAQFKLNPIVTLQHAYHLPPVGRSMWRKVVKDGPRQGVKAKSHYPPRPDDWPDQSWPADVAFCLVQADLLRGKSIGFLPTKVHSPTREERGRAGWSNVQLVIDEWILLEYACCYLPCQPGAVVESVSKDIQVPLEFKQVMGWGEEQPVGFTPMEDFETAIHRTLANIDWTKWSHDLVSTQVNRQCGRI